MQHQLRTTFLPNLRPFVDVLLNETAEGHSNTAPATCPKDQREQKKQAWREQRDEPAASRVTAKSSTVAN
jgi:hypothetical protein